MISVIPERPVGAWWATGLTTAERRQTAEPEWAGFITRAIAGAAPSEPPDDWRDALAAIFTPLVAVVRARVGRAVGSLPDIHHDRVTDGIARNLGGKLVTLAVRTLVFELNRARVDGTLQGATPEARFIDFTRRAGTIDGLTRLFAEYPVLARLTGQACLHTLDSTVEVLTRFAEDRPAITTAFGHDTLGTLIDVQDNAGDSHARGRSVRILEFSCGRKVVYKPRPLDLHVRFTGVVRWLNGRLPGLELSTVDALLRPGYGWLEFIEHAPCADLDDVDRFYRRQGVLLALLHALDATDVHYENIIAAADQPVLVDVETLFQPPPPGFVADDPASEVLARSVQRTMLLPRLMVGDRGALDVSGLGGRGGQLPNDQVQWADAGTDRMRLTRVAADLPGAFNLPYLDAEGAEVDPAEHSAALLGGFRAGYDAIAAGRAELTNLLEGGRDDPIRVLLRSTNYYARLLDETTHPKLLHDADARDQAFDLLETDADGEPTLLRLAPAERAELWAGDIPLFASSPGSTTVWDSSGIRHPDVLKEPTLDVVLAKLRGMTTVDQRDQEWLISAALATSGAEVRHTSVETVDDVLPSQAPDAAQLLAAACGIADQIVARAFTKDGRTNWIGLELVDDRHWTVLPMGAGLGEGYTGVALFLSQLAILTGIARYHDLAVRAIRPLPQLLAKLGEDPDLANAAGCGGPLGLGGVAYAVTRLKSLLADSVADGLVEQSIGVMPYADRETNPTFALGLAGGLAAMRAVHAETGLGSASRLAAHYAEALSGAKVPGRGFATGSAGIAWALGRTAVRATDEADIAALSGNDHGWCSGLTGALLAYAEVTGGDDLPEHAVTSLAERAPLKDLSLCHGESGIIEGLCVLAGSGHTGAASAVRLRTGRLLAALDRHGARCGTPSAVPAPGLLTGLAGIGYGLLRLGFTTQVPSALLMQQGPGADTELRG